MDTALARVADALRRAHRVTVLTGAGVSAASGVPTFRGADGLWRQHRAETLATPDAFARDPLLVWQWYDWRRQMIRDARPNAAHTVLADWTRTRPGFTLITQNVDGLHERAGADPIVRLHGSIWHVRCANQCARGRDDRRDETVPLPSLPPRCPHCDGYVRPGVVWFGEPLDANIVARATAATQCDVFMSVGTSSVVYPAAGLIHAAKRHGALTVEINPDRTEATSAVDVALTGGAELMLPALDRCLR